MATFSAIDKYLGLTSSSQINIFGGKYIDCDICNANINNSNLQNCNLNNSYIQKSVVVDSKIEETVCVDSDIESSNSLIIRNVDVWTYIPSATSSNLDGATGVLKIYIDDFEIDNLNIFDSIYLTSLNKRTLTQLLNLDQIIELPYETRWVFNRFFNDDLGSEEIKVSFKKSNENTYKTILIRDLDVYSPVTYLNDVVDGNNKPYGSIDIEIGNYFASSYFGLNHYLDFYIDVYSRPIIISATISFVPILDVDTTINLNLTVRNSSLVEVPLDSQYFIPRGSNSTFLSKETLRNFIIDTSTFSVSYSILSDTRINWTPRFFVRLIPGDSGCECCTTTTTLAPCPSDVFTYSISVGCPVDDFTYSFETITTSTTTNSVTTSTSTTTTPPTTTTTTTSTTTTPPTTTTTTSTTSILETYNISGAVRYFNSAQTPFVGITVSLFDSSVNFVTSSVTNYQGDYDFGTFSFNQYNSFYIKIGGVTNSNYQDLYGHNKPWGGVSIADASSTPTVSTINWWAKDVNGDGVLDSVDGNLIQARSINPANTTGWVMGDWVYAINGDIDATRFYPGWQMTNTQPAHMSIGMPFGPTVGSNFVQIWALCVGDTNGSYVP
jgi:hypothetical protein